MLHPDIVVRKSRIEGKGLFAAKRIPLGTIVWRFGPARVYSSAEYAKLSLRYKKVLNRHAYEENDGKIVYCLDGAQYSNHSCDANVSPCSFSGEFNGSFDGEFDVAIRDIAVGEEVTYDYAFLNFSKLRGETFKCNCGSPRCRRVIKRVSRNSKLARKQRSLAKKAEARILQVKQPLLTGDEKKNLARRVSRNCF